MSARRPTASETQAHVAILQWLEWVLPDGYAVHHSPNEGKRTKAAGSAMKRAGTKKGWPDLEVIRPGGEVFFIEVKREAGGSLSKEQKELRSHFIEHGIPYALCRSIDEAREALIGWGVSTREHAA